MKFSSKRFISLLLALVMICGMMPSMTIEAFAAEESVQTTQDNPWNSRSAVFVGDSITAGSGTTKIYYEYLKESLGLGTVSAMGVAGSCISAVSDYGQSNQPLINRYQDIPSADLIVIFMGTNDYGHETPLGTVEDTQDGTFYGALNAIVPALVAKHTSSKIVFVTPLHRYGFGTSKILGTQFTYDHIPNGVDATLGDYVDAIKTVCANNGVSVIDLYTECTLDPTDSAVREQYMPDGLHPNAAGHELIAGILASHIQEYSPAEKAPEHETEPEEETELVYGNKFSSTYNQQNRASSRVNLYLKAGTVITLKDTATFQWACTKTDSESSTANLGYFPDSAWSDKTTAVVETDGWVGFVFKYRDESQVFDLSKPLSDYITIEEPHTHSYSPTVTAPTCTEQGYTTYTCECGESYVSDYVEAYGLHDTNTDKLYNAITVRPGQLDSNTDGDILESGIYSFVVNYPLKKGHVLSISNENYVFSVRKLENGNYSTMLKQATADSFTAIEDMTVGMLIRKPDKSALTAEELAGIVIYDSQFGMIGVEGSVKRFTVEAETIDGGTATTRAALFLPESYSGSGTPTRLIVMTNGRHAYLTDSVWNGNSADDIGVMKHYLDNDYAVLIVNNTADKINGTDDWGNPQLVDSYWKAYDYVQKNFNLEELFSIHSRSMGTFAAVRMMREHPERIKCAVMCGAVLSLESRFANNSAFIAQRYGFNDTTGSTWEADKVVGYDPYTDVNGMEYDLPPTFWMLAEADATTIHLGTIEKIKDHGNDVIQKIYTETDHSGVCRLNIEACRVDALTFLEKYQNTSPEHRFCAWKTTKEATCTAEGEMRRYCADCDYYEATVIPMLSDHVFVNSDSACDSCGKLFDVSRTEIKVVSGQLDGNSDGIILTSDIYGSVVAYELKAGHTLSIGDENYVFSVRIMKNGTYSTMLKAATVDVFTAEEDMIVGCLIRKPDKSVITAEELDGIVLYDTIRTEHTHTYENGICSGCGATNGPVITKQPESVQVAIGEKFSVKVEAQGEGLTYQWYYKHKDSADFTASSFKTSAYSMTMASYCHNREIYCVITDANGNSVQTETVLITAPLTITKQPADTEVAIGGKISISVQAVGDGLTYQWYYSGNGGKSFAVSSFKGKSYSMTMQEYCHNRQVYCVVTDQYGNSVTSDIATITRPPVELVILSQPQDVQVEIGQRAAITVEVQGEGLTYQWYYKNAGSKSFTKSSFSGSTYAMKMAEFCHNRQVYCVITDQYGNSVTSEIATMSRPPLELKILEQPTDVYATVGDPFSVTFTVQGEGLTYQWYYKDNGGKTFKTSSFTGDSYSMTTASWHHGRQVYCVITDQYGNQVTTDIATLYVEN